MFEKYGKLCGMVSWYRPVRRLAKQNPSDLGKTMLFMSIMQAIHIACMSWLKTQETALNEETLRSAIDKAYNQGYEDGSKESHFDNWLTKPTRGLAN